MLMFRNIDVDPSQPVAEWGVEGILSAIERGSAIDWGRVLLAYDAAAPGSVLRLEVREALACADPELPIVALFTYRMDKADSI